MNTRLKFALVGALIGAVVGSGIGIAGSFGAVQGTGVVAIVGAIIGFLAVPDIKKNEPKIKKVRLASIGLIGMVLKPILNLLKRK